MGMEVPSWLQWYKKPAYVDIKAFAASFNTKIEESDNEITTTSGRNSVLSQRSDVSVPKNLTLERVLNGRTCSPMSLYDFYMYLKHIEFSAENLEFYEWFKDYEKRYYQQVEKAKKGEHLTLLKSDPITSYGTGFTSKMAADTTVKEWILDSKYSEQLALYIEALIVHDSSKYPKPCSTNIPDRVASGGPPTVFQQNQEELRHVIDMFIIPGGPKELNIPPSLRKQTIAAIATSDSPEHFRKIFNHVYALLKDCSHRNFVRLGVNNGTFETLCMVTMVGISFTIFGFLLMFLLAFASPSIHHSSRWRGLGAIPFWFIGISFLLAGMRGSCFLLLLFSRRQELPWERVDEEKSMESNPKTEERGYFSLKAFAKKLMIFERKISVKDVGLRRLQRKIVIQSIAGAVIGTTILEIFFLSLPIWE